MKKQFITITLLLSISSCVIDDIKNDMIESEMDGYNTMGAVVTINDRTITPIKRIETGSGEVNVYDTDDNQITLNNDKMAIALNAQNHNPCEHYIIKLLDDNETIINYFIAYEIGYVGKTLVIYTNTNIVYWTGKFDIVSVNLQQLDNLLFE